MQESSGIRLMHGDCMELMKTIPDMSVDLCLVDLPYGVLNKSNPSAKWDSIIPFEPLWEQYKRIAKPNAAIVLYLVLVTCIVKHFLGVFLALCCCLLVPLVLLLHSPVFVCTLSSIHLSPVFHLLFCGIEI